MMAIEREDFMTWLGDALTAYAENGGDPRYNVDVTVEGEEAECSVEYWHEDNEGTEPDDSEVLRLTIK
jgi:hypothetical protein